jgi:hypothetical protein
VGWFFALGFAGSVGLRVFWVGLHSLLPTSPPWGPRGQMAWRACHRRPVAALQADEDEDEDEDLNGVQAAARWATMDRIRVWDLWLSVFC